MYQKSKKSAKSSEQDKRNLRAPSGMRDILPADRPYWDRIESVARDMARLLGFGLIETPILEFAELFIKTNEDADMVRKEMYSFKTKGGDHMALRPEYTAPKMRAYMEHSLSRLGQPQKLWNMGPVFRHDRPQFGRYRQFHQIDFDIIGGGNDPIYDAEIIFVFTSFLNDLKLENTSLQINSVGCRVCRPIYKKQLQSFYASHKKRLCGDCVRRLETNPLRLLDCKKEDCEKLKEGAPNFLDKLCSICSGHFKGVLEYLDELKIVYTLNHRLVRGLDYYSKTVFEIYAEGAGSEVGAIVAGGRYDYLMEMIGGSLTPAVGAACGVERIIAVMKSRDIKISPRPVKKVFLIHAGESAKRKVFGLMKEFREAGIVTSETLAKDSLKAQLKVADKESAIFSLILGQKEIHDGTVIVRNMQTGLQDTVLLDKVVAEVKKRMK